MDYREEDVAIPWARTFEWLLPQPVGDLAEESPVERQRFLDWMRSLEPGLFWICGKAGSGKSTLMKKLFRHTGIRRSIESWASPNPVAFAAFYFFDRGESPLQKSREGLLRAILHQLISAYPELASSLTAITSSARSTLPSGNSIDWSWERLRAAFDIIREQPARTEKIKVCLFLDGLDEYSALDMPAQQPMPGGSSDDQLDNKKYHQMRRQNLNDIRDLVLSLAASPIMKICVSSRPLTTFESALGRMPLVRLEELTAPDIHRFISGKFDESTKWKEISFQSTEGSSSLIDNIVRKASGVFLWVKLVVDKILEELEDGSYLPELQRYIDSLPTELNELYKRMIENVKDDHREQGFKLFRLFLATRSPVSAVVFHFAETETTEYVLSSQRGDKTILTSQEGAMITNQMRNRLRSRCAGLLEVSYLPFRSKYGDCDDEPGYLRFHVQFLHQTVKEFLTRDTAWSSLYPPKPADRLEILLSHLRASILGLKRIPRTVSRPEELESGKLSYAWKLVYNAIYYAQLIEREENDKKTLVALLDDLDSTGSSVFVARNDRYPKGHWIMTEPHFSGGRDLLSQDDFLSFAIQAGLRTYVVSKLQKPVQKKEGKPYLEYAVATLHNGHAIRMDSVLMLWRFSLLRPAELALVSIILNHGADPNDFYEGDYHHHPGNTVWGSVLSMSLSMMYGMLRPPVAFQVLYSDGRDRGEMYREDRRRLIENIKLLIKAGADPNARVQFDEPDQKSLIALKISSSPLGILHFALQDCPQERDEILQMLRERGAVDTEPSEVQSSKSSLPIKGGMRTPDPQRLGGYPPLVPTDTIGKEHQRSRSNPRRLWERLANRRSNSGNRTADAN